MMIAMNTNPSQILNLSKKHSWKKQDTRDLKHIIEQGLKTEPYAFMEHDVLGVPVYINNFDFSPCIHIRVGFKYGAIHDAAGKEGTAHFLEHMLFDGSSIFENEKETQEFGKTILLDTLNAYTSLFELFITGKTLPHHFETALTGIFSMINHPLLTEKSYEHEKKVITQEAWGRFLNEKRIEYIKKEKANNLYDLPDRARTGSALGWPETVLNITHQDLLDARATYFVKENMSIYLAGNLDSVGGTDNILKIITQFLHETPNGTKSKTPYVPNKIGAPKSNIFDHTFEDAGLTDQQQASIDLSSMLPRFPRTNRESLIKELKHMTCLRLASDLVGDIVFRKLRLENSWCYGAGASAKILTDHLGFSIGGKVDKNHTEEAISIIWSVIDEIKKGQFKDDFDKSKILMIDNTLARERTTGNIIDSVMESIKINGEIFTLRTYLEYMSEVTFEEVQKIIAQYMKKDIVFTEILRPKSDQQTS